MNKEAFKSKLKDDFKVRLVLLLILGLLIGAVTKIEARESLVIGFDDYRVKSYAQGYDFEAIVEDMRAEVEAIESVGDEAMRDSVEGSE